ncbi:MAG TPA: hypothetical protein VFI06_03020, partial [Chitinophagaceae bacterium]|nr:hypothetical protein [Chitinophagaceae bacterium]
MRPNLFILLFIAFAIPSCHAQQKDDGRTYNKEYAVGSIPSVNNFLTLTKQEKELDSLFNSEYNSTGNSQKLRHMPGNSFRSNRAR